MALKLLLINGLTLIRVIGTFILVPIYKNLGGFYVGILSLICYLTDSIDGILARGMKASTFFGALFDGVADKLFTIINFIVLYLITPYALIPIVFEILIVLVQVFKYNRNYNLNSNIIGKSKVWVLAISVVLIFLLSDISNIIFLPANIKEFLISITNKKLYFYLLFPAIIMEALTLLSYLLEIFTPTKYINPIMSTKELDKIDLGKSKWENFKKIWLNPDFYQKHKDDASLRSLNKIMKNH